MVSNELLQRDRVLLAIIGLLSYFTLSGVLAPMGLLIDPISAQFNVSDVVAARLLSGFSSGNLLGAVLALFVMSWFGYKRIVIAIYASAAAILLSLGLLAPSPCLVLTCWPRFDARDRPSSGGAVDSRYIQIRPKSSAARGN